MFSWTEEEFLKKMQGSPIRRIGYDAWLRNIAVALGNLMRHLVENKAVDKDTSRKITRVLEEKKTHPSKLVREHIDWALRQYS